MKTSKAVHPNVRCMKPEHADEPGYVICVHVIQGVKPGHFFPATPRRMGEIACLPCFKNLTGPFVVACAACARANEWTPK